MKLNLTTDQKEIIIRKGGALPPQAPKSINIQGTLGAPHQFLIGRGEFDQKKTHLEIEYDNGVIRLVMDDTDPYTTHTITGSLTRDKHLSTFRINTDHRWTVRGFLTFIKTMKFFFYEDIQHEKLIESLQKWSVKVERVIKDHNDNTGNSLFQLETKINELNLLNKFSLNIPIFQGYAKKIFNVEIGLDPKSTTVELFLISSELYELEHTFREQLITQEVAKFSQYEFAKVVIS